MVVGCGLWQKPHGVQRDSHVSYYQYAATQIEYPDLEAPSDYAVAVTPPPLDLEAGASVEYWDLTLEEAVQLALANSKVLRNLGGAILQSPTSVHTTHDPAIQQTDPRFGVAAALSAFDASFAYSAFFEKNDRLLNNTFFGGGTRSLQQDDSVLQAQITKLAATGTELTIRNNTDYDSNNAPGNQFESVWNTNIEAEVRHPLFQGGGVDFNRIAGPSDVPGVMNGVVLARINTDISLADFEISVRDFLSNVENAYWDLYFAYRDLHAKITARDAALETWRRIHALYLAGRRGGEAEKEAQARQQYFRFQEDVQNALTGRLIEQTQTNNGSSGGTFRGTGGVYVAERRLRLLMGLSINDGRLIRPSDEPLQAQVIFDWDDILIESLTRRAELRRQKWLVKRREKELKASKNFLLPTLDFVGRYRWRGLGHDLLKQHDGAPLSRTGTPADNSVNNAWGNLTSGNYQEWQLGFEFEFPFGRRKAHAAVRNAELLLARERAILKEQEREVVHDLSDAIVEMQRAYSALETDYNRLLASREQLAAVQAAYEADSAPLDLVLDAQRRLAESESAYFRALVEHSLAVKNVQFEKGSLLDYCDVYLAEGLWPVKAYYDAKKRRNSTFNMEWFDPFLTRPGPVSSGTYQQLILTPESTGESTSSDEPRSASEPSDLIPASFEDGSSATSTAANEPPDTDTVLTDRAGDGDASAVKTSQMTSTPGDGASSPDASTATDATTIPIGDVSE